MKCLSRSKYSEKFVFKGGFLLSNIVGINTRSTVDIDLLLKNETLSEANVSKVFRKILMNNAAEEIMYSLQSVSPYVKKTSMVGLGYLFCAS